VARDVFLFITLGSGRFCSTASFLIGSDRPVVALLRCSIGGCVDEANAVAGSDCFGEFVECSRDSQVAGPGVDAEVVVAAA
jgi:hypothetical protein